MSDYQHILVPTDFSTHSEAAARRAADLAKRYGARLSVLHVVDYVPPGYVRVDEPEASEDRLVAAAREALREWVGRLGLEVANAWVDTVSSARRGIVGRAKQAGVDLIVVGSHGEHGLASLLGSTTSAVIHHAVCDVLSVHAES